MWVVENKYKVFFYQENGGKVIGSYTIVIKIVICLSPLAYKPNGIGMIVRHGHENGVFIDATFGTNDKKVWNLTN